MRSKHRELFVVQLSYNKILLCNQVVILYGIIHIQDWTMNQNGSIRYRFDPSRSCPFTFIFPFHVQHWTIFEASYTPIIYESFGKPEWPISY